MKKYIIANLLLLMTLFAFGQAKKPTIMVVPSDVWCTKNGYILDYDNQGSIERIPDYKMALQENSDLLLVVSKIGGLMADRGFTLKTLEGSLKSLQSESAEDALLTSKNGAEVNESPIDKLKKTAKSDIIMQMTWTINQTGPKKSVTFILNGIDSYTDKQVASASGTGLPSFSAELPVLLEEAVLSQLDNFNSQLQAHFEDLLTNGREVSLRIKTFSNFEGDLENEYEGEELGAIIEKWISLNTVEGRFSTTDATESMMFFEQVRIPLYDSNNRAIDARGWARDLQKMLKDKYAITAKLMTKGQGQAT
ncbi:MAG: DUF6175 family protein, partial [Ignavibacteria bacterium]|nr:DUF6175 family protein [Ignavibacteria bacterium]